MVRLQAELNKIEGAGIQLVAISYDSAENLKEFADKNKITFPLLSDAGSKTIDAYGVRNEKTEPGSRQDGIPHPGTFLVDKDGVVRAKLFYSVVRRHTPAELIEAAEKIK